jgi:hypothetical protein
LKAVIINSAQPFQQRPPNVAEGFGTVNLGPWLPFAGDSFSVLIADCVSITDKQHLVSSHDVIGTTKQLRITLSYLDVRANPDAWFPLLSDLDLVVISPMKRVFRGNHRADGSEEHFSVNERVIIFSSELEIGTYEIHGNDTCTFLSFTPATACIPGCLGTCDEKTGICDCLPERIGESCRELCETCVSFRFA